MDRLAKFAMITENSSGQLFSSQTGMKSVGGH